MKEKTCQMTLKEFVELCNKCGEDILESTEGFDEKAKTCLLYTSPSPRDRG